MDYSDWTGSLIGGSIIAAGKNIEEESVISRKSLMEQSSKTSSKMSLSRSPDSRHWVYEILDMFESITSSSALRTHSVLMDHMIDSRTAHTFMMAVHTTPELKNRYWMLLHKPISFVTLVLVDVENRMRQTCPETFKKHMVSFAEEHIDIIIEIGKISRHLKLMEYHLVWMICRFFTMVDFFQFEEEKIDDISTGISKAMWFPTPFLQGVLSIAEFSVETFSFNDEIRSHLFPRLIAMLNFKVRTKLKAVNPKVHKLLEKYQSLGDDRNFDSWVKNTKCVDWGNGRKTEPPSCQLCGDDASKKPAKCGRCDAIYCCKAHQIDAWRNHQFDCFCKKCGKIRKCDCEKTYKEKQKSEPPPNLTKADQHHRIRHKSENHVMFKRRFDHHRMAKSENNFDLHVKRESNKSCMSESASISSSSDSSSSSSKGKFSMDLKFTTINISNPKPSNTPSNNLRTKPKRSETIKKQSKSIPKKSKPKNHTSHVEPNFQVAMWPAEEDEFRSGIKFRGTRVNDNLLRVPDHQNCGTKSDHNGQRSHESKRQTRHGYRSF